MADEFQEAVDAFETILDKENAPEKAPARRAKKDDDGPEDLFPQREIEGEPADEDDDGEIPEEYLDEDGRPKQPVDDEDEEEEGPEEEEEEPAQTALDLDQIVRVNVDGEPAEVSLQEALNGYVRSETFHRRLNQLGQVAQQVQQERAELAQGREYYMRMIPALQQQLASLQPQEPDWDKLYEENPQEAARLERLWRSYREKMGKLTEEQQRVAQEQEQEQQRQIAIYEDTERRKLAQWVPEWTDPKRWERDRRAMIKTALAAGYSEKELGGLRDARATIVLAKAAKYDLLMANKPRPVKRQGSLRPGAISSRAAPNGLLRAEKRLQRSGNVRDAARAFEADLDREG
jgi:hypothetical protein